MKHTKALCSILLLVSSTAIYAQPTLVIGGGASTTNESLNAQLGSEVYWSLNGPTVGFRIASSLAIPTRVESNTGTSGWVFEEVDGASTLTTLTGILGWTFTVDRTRLSILGTIGGANITHRRSELDYEFDTVVVSYANPTWTYGAMLDLSYKLTDQWSLHLGAGYDHIESTRPMVENEPPAKSYRAVFAGPQTWCRLGVGFSPFDSAMIDPLRPGGHRKQWFVGASIGSIHPFEPDTYNEFNPGFFSQYRLSSDRNPWFVEAGGYQYSMSDLAVYAGGGILFTIAPEFFASEFLKIGLFGGLLAAQAQSGPVLTPVLSPRIVVDTHLGSVSVVIIPAWESTAFGLTYAIPMW
ncbi:MAG: hypothetical protein IPF59_00805 [Ignavibacteria bacterium]|nr:hypothetical protein [Ignavibacteria bacterium]